MPKLAEIVKQYIIPEMTYKLDGYLELERVKLVYSPIILNNAIYTEKLLLFNFSVYFRVNEWYGE